VISSPNSRLITLIVPKQKVEEFVQVCSKRKDKRQFASAHPLFHKFFIIFGFNQSN